MRTLALIVLLTDLLTSAVAHADSLGADRVRALVERGEILPLTDILKRNEERVGGRIIEVEIEQKRGTYVYEIKVLRADGRYRELKIDARTGAMIRDE
jgi:uncharacterized membrane protein YkoI